MSRLVLYFLVCDIIKKKIFLEKKISSSNNYYRVARELDMTTAYFKEIYK